MLKVSTEFRKGIFFVRLIGRIDNEGNLKNIYDLVEEIGIRYVVLNLNFLNDVSLENIKYIMNYANTILKKNKLLIICDQSSRRNRLFKNLIPKISREVEAFSLIRERTT